MLNKTKIHFCSFKFVFTLQNGNLSRTLSEIIELVKKERIKNYLKKQALKSIKILLKKTPNILTKY